MLKIVVKKQETVLGSDHPFTLISKANLASTLWSSGQWKKAVDLLVLVKEKQGRLLGLEHPSVLTTMASLAATLWNQGRWEEAKRLRV